MPAVTPEVSVLTQDQWASAIRAQLLVVLCVGLLSYGVFIATTLLTVCVLIHKKPYQSWKFWWHFLLAACVMFLIGTCDVAFTIWVNFRAINMDLNGTRAFTLFNNHYTLYVYAHVRWISFGGIGIKLTACARKVPFTC
jgi:hypothetical protein